MFSVADLSKEFLVGGQKHQVLSQLSFDINSEQITAIVGPSGAGKSTLLSILCGLESADNGSIFYRDLMLHNMTSDELAALRNNEFGFIFQSPFYLPYKTVIENVLLASAYSLKSTEEMLDRANELLTLVGLADHKHNSPALLSGGEQQRMAFARAMLLQPKVIFADEPTASLDQVNSEKLLALLSEQASSGKTVVLVSHDNEAIQWANTILELSNKGQAISER